MANEVAVEYRWALDTESVVAVVKDSRDGMESRRGDNAARRQLRARLVGKPVLLMVERAVSGLANSMELFAEHSGRYVFPMSRHHLAKKLRSIEPGLKGIADRTLYQAMPGFVRGRRAVQRAHSDAT